MKKVKKVAGFSLYILIILLLALIIRGLAFQRTVVSGDSMYPSLNDGDSLIVNKLAYRFKEPKRYDVIVFPYSATKRIYYVKRIIGLPGETVEIREGVILIDGVVLPYKYNRDPIENPGTAATEIKLGEREFFVLGDNVGSSIDSRSPDVGNVYRDQIIGKVFLRIRPVKDFGVIE